MKKRISENLSALETFQDLQKFQVGDIVEHTFSEAEVGTQKGVVVGVRAATKFRGIYEDIYYPSIEVSFEGSVYDEFLPTDLTIVRKFNQKTTEVS